MISSNLPQRGQQTEKTQIGAVDQDPQFTILFNMLAKRTCSNLELIRIEINWACGKR